MNGRRCKWSPFVLFFVCLTFAVPVREASSTTKDPQPLRGRSVIVHLFEWTFRDIARECESFLGPRGYGAVQTSPVNEHGIIRDGNVKRPWYERYQPVSYKIQTRSGSEEEFRDMVHLCNQAGVRIYVDVVFNHMTGNLKNNRGTAGSYFNYDERRYDGVPYTWLDFHSSGSCHTSSGTIENYADASQVRNCQLSGLLDLNQTREYVRDKVVEFLDRLIGHGVAGFRVDAAKHMSTEDLGIVYGRLRNLTTQFFSPGSRPFIYQEVIDMGGGEPVRKWDYVPLGRVTEFLYGKYLAEVLLRKNGQLLKNLRTFGEDWGMLPGGDAVTFVSNHDNQRGHGGAGDVLTFFTPRLYKMATAFMLACPHGLPRVMSSYYWQRNFQNGHDVNDWIGPPQDSAENIAEVITYPNNTCGNGWICEHRWRQIYNMVRFRNIAGFEPVSHWWDNGYQAIAFGRGNSAFIAINNEDNAISANFNTGLPPGTYCDVISGSREGNRCTGKQVVVDTDGRASLTVDSAWEDPMIAFHLQSKL